jgi:hypothetical protein
MTEALPFENYRTDGLDGSVHHLLPQSNMVSHRNNNHLNGVKRSSSSDNDNVNDDDDHEREDGDDDDQQQQQHQRDKSRSRSKTNGHNIPALTKPTDTIGISSSPKNKISSSFIDTSVRTSPNASVNMMMTATTIIKENGTKRDDIDTTPVQLVQHRPLANENRSVTVPSTFHPTSSGTSSSSSSSMPFDERQQRYLKARRYNFVPAPFNGTRLIAKSTEQLNRSYANDSLGNYSGSTFTPSFQMSSKVESHLSVAKQIIPQKFTHSTLVSSTSKTHEQMS